MAGNVYVADRGRIFENRYASPNYRPFGTERLAHSLSIFYFCPLNTSINGIPAQTPGATVTNDSGPADLFSNMVIVCQISGEPSARRIGMFFPTGQGSREAPPLEATQANTLNQTCCDRQKRPQPLISGA